MQDFIEIWDLQTQDLCLICNTENHDQCNISEYEDMSHVWEEKRRISRNT